MEYAVAQLYDIPTVDLSEDDSVRPDQPIKAVDGPSKYRRCTAKCGTSSRARKSVTTPTQNKRNSSTSSKDDSH